MSEVMSIGTQFEFFSLILWDLSVYMKCTFLCQMIILKKVFFFSFQRAGVSFSTTGTMLKPVINPLLLFVLPVL